MCGIAGFFLSQSRSEEDANDMLMTMSERIRHRGPDGNGEWLDTSNRVGLTARDLLFQPLCSVTAHRPG